MRLGTHLECVESLLRVSGGCHDGVREFAGRRSRLIRRLSRVAKNLTGSWEEDATTNQHSYCDQILGVIIHNTLEGVVYISLASGTLRMPQQNTWALAPSTHTLCRGVNEAHFAFSGPSSSDSRSFGFGMGVGESPSFFNLFKGGMTSMDMGSSAARLGGRMGCLGVGSPGDNRLLHPHKRVIRQCRRHETTKGLKGNLTPASRASMDKLKPFGKGSKGHCAASGTCRSMSPKIRCVALILGREDSIMTKSSSYSMSMASRAFEDLSSMEDDGTEGEQSPNSSPH
ncbi:hypothetical protein B296_00021909 [Ensete ventricosum]|uniref:Uncharacterized protein n=1 Tax=Ensete ventricosum TaxID=4639 RepID=A0A427AQ28_ENSVE|nr:hypothetical protein B296_00021909 [Ensete ventricosum]